MNSFFVLQEPLLEVTRQGTRQRVDLPGLLELLGGEQPVELHRLQRHHQGPVFTFLVQLAALALLRTEDRSPKKSADTWRRLLLELTEGAREPWCLLVEDAEKPAFLQPPPGKPGSCAKALAALKPPVATPEAADTLVTAKNHDVKSERFVDAEPDDWFYTLIALQTTEGYSGRDNHGIARMNGGFASRPSVAITPDAAWPPSFRRQVAVLLEARRAQLEGEWSYVPEGGHALLWMLPWDGSESLTVDQLDPFFIEVCRRVRLVDLGGRLAVRLGTSKAPRLAAKDFKGRLGDPFVPINKDGPALTVSGSGLTYRLLHKVLFSGHFELPAALEIRDQDGPRPLLVVRVLARGQGQTDGYHERTIPLAPKIVSIFAQPDEREKLGALSEARIEKVADAQRRVLLPAVCALLQGGLAKLDLRDAGARPWLDRLDQAVDREFFERLWNDIAETREEQERRWHRYLRDLATQLFEQALENVRTPEARRERAEASALDRFGGGLRKHLGAAFEETTDLEEAAA